MALTPKLLYQGRPTDTAASVLVPTSGITYVVTEIWAYENSGGTPTLTIYHHNAGTTFNTTTFIHALVFTANLPLRLTGLNIVLDNTSSNLGMKSSTTQQVTVTVYGYQIT